MKILCRGQRNWLGMEGIRRYCFVWKTSVITGPGVRSITVEFFGPCWYLSGLRHKLYNIFWHFCPDHRFGFRGILVPFCPDWYEAFWPKFGEICPDRDQGSPGNVIDPSIVLLKMIGFEGENSMIADNAIHGNDGPVWRTTCDLTYKTGKANK